jgi:hypothetical protein
MSVHHCHRYLDNSLFHQPDEDLDIPYITEVIQERSFKHHDKIEIHILYFNILLHSFNTEYLFFCPSM